LKTCLPSSTASQVGSTACSNCNLEIASRFACDRLENTSLRCRKLQIYKASLRRNYSPAKCRPSAELKVKWKQPSPRTAPVKAIAQVAQSTKSSPRTKKLSLQKATITPQNKERSTATDNPGKGFAPTSEVLNVHDGDTLKVRQGQLVERVRMACIDAPELAQPLGKESRHYLKSMITQNGDRVTLKIVDTDR